MAGPDHARRASDRVHEALRAEVLEGTLRPGAAVPSERVPAERLGVHRQSVREALKRLEQAGLVQVSHGGPTRVLDWRDSGGLEVLADLARGGEGPPPVDLAQSVLEMRASIGIDAVASRACSASWSRPPAPPPASARRPPTPRIRRSRPSSAAAAR